MQVTIINDPVAGCSVGIDGLFYVVSVPPGSLPATFHALQWDGTSGELEHRMSRCEHCGARSKKGNEVLANLTPYQPLLDAWHVAKTADDAQKARAAKAQADLREAAANVNLSAR